MSCIINERRGFKLVEWYLSVRDFLGEIYNSASRADEVFCDHNETAIDGLKRHMHADFIRLIKISGGRLPERELKSLELHIHTGSYHDFYDILNEDIPRLQGSADEALRAWENSVPSDQVSSLKDLLHPRIKYRAYQQYLDGHFRSAVLDSVIAVFDFIREKSGSDLDGDRLVGQVLSTTNPELVLSELRTESGQNEQKGFMQIFKGVYQGIRNPKAHSLDHDLDETKTAQYLVFMSLLARTIEEAKLARPINVTQIKPSQST